jgi:hypothetical protein
MKTEDVTLNIKEIFDQKNLEYTPADVARMRYCCRSLVEFVADWLK